MVNKTVVRTGLASIFVDRNDIVYATDEFHDRILMWNTDSDKPTIINLYNMYMPHDLFVTIDKSIYVLSSSKSLVDKLLPNTTKGTIVMVNDCFGLFIDIDNYLYCSINNEHKVVKKSLDNDINKLIIVAGTGKKGLDDKRLDDPRGIFVDINFDLYVADCGNNRVQLFKSKQLGGITVAGNDAELPFRLICPTEIFLDGNGYLFIMDAFNRIIGSKSNGFYCIYGCSDKSDIDYYEVYAAAFDSHGNIFLIDKPNDRILKLHLLTNTSSK